MLRLLGYLVSVAILIFYFTQYARIPPNTVDGALILGYLEDMMVAPVREVELEVVPFDDLTQGGTWGEMETWGRRAHGKIDDGSTGD